MYHFKVTGMSCAACSARVEKTVRNLPAVRECAVNLLTGDLTVEGDLPPEEILRAVKKAGYGISFVKPKGEKGKKGEKSAKNEVDSPPNDPFYDAETPKLRKRLILSLIVLAALMYVSMGHTMAHFPLPSLFDENPVGVGLLQMNFSGLLLLINRKFFINGAKGIQNRAPNMDTLIALGSGVSYLWSLFVLFSMTRASADGDTARATALLHELYFESAGMILALITVGKLLEARSKGKTTDALRGLLTLAPKTATVLRPESCEGACPIDTENARRPDGQTENRREVTVSIDDLAVGDLFVVRAGEKIPADGVVVEGEGAVDESHLTGESIPIDKTVGSPVSCAAVNRSGYLVCRATRVGENTTLSQIIQTVSTAQSTKAPIARLADRVSAIFVPTVMVLALITFAVWLLIGQTFDYALARAVSVLVISCPCALGLATPVAVMVGSGVGAKHGILFKTAESLEQTGKITTAALDKTGTVTNGKPTVTDLVPAEGVTTDELLQSAVTLEQKSEHPLARAIVAYGAEHGFAAEETENFMTFTGSGVTAICSGRVLYGGNRTLTEKFLTGRAIAEHILGEPEEEFANERNADTDETESILPHRITEKAEQLANEGKTPLYFLKDGRFLGLIAVADTVKDDSREALAEFSRMGIRTVLLTGDNPNTAKAVAEAVGIDDVIAGVLPHEKAETVTALKQSTDRAGNKKTGRKTAEKVAMIGDGVNDAPALASADIGMAIGAGADIAVDAAEIVLMKNSLRDAVRAVKLSRATLRCIKQNLFWAFFYNIIGIPLAAGCFVRFGLTLNPMIGAAAMSLSGFCVVTNALRLNFVKLK